MWLPRGRRVVAGGCHVVASGWQPVADWLPLLVAATCHPPNRHLSASNYHLSFLHWYSWRITSPPPARWADWSRSCGCDQVAIPMMKNGVSTNTRWRWNTTISQRRPRQLPIADALFLVHDTSGIIRDGTSARRQGRYCRASFCVRGSILLKSFAKIFYWSENPILPLKVAKKAAAGVRRRFRFFLLRWRCCWRCERMLVWRVCWKREGLGGDW